MLTHRVTYRFLALLLGSFSWICSGVTCRNLWGVSPVSYLVAVTGEASALTMKIGVSHCQMSNPLIQFANKGRDLLVACLMFRLSGEDIQSIGPYSQP